RGRRGRRRGRPRSGPLRASAMTPVDWDVAVVGGGPAGAISATLLGRRGFRAVLVDEGRPAGLPFPETLSPGSLRLLEGLDFPVPSIAADARPCRRIEAAW